MPKCNGPTCGAEIIWLKTAAGKSMCVEDGEVAAAFARDGAVYDPKNEELVPHWATCPDRDSFRRK